ncbi:MAG: sigma-54 dependent transcriptional regulator [Acidobacteria bacterium]|nr:sigma-54 dependent transcriptional regulator [Acidobacteriota bacterium]MCA1609881.1 sigma-54 dependent transcriptional regulator [Acidobacteriota bacterium]
MPNILVVEDKSSLRAMLEEMLQAEGWTVVGVGTAEGAADRLRAGEKFDVVLTDWRLPGADGLSVLDAARGVDVTLPVIVMTAFGSIETAVDAMKRGAEEFITKPVDPDLLRLLVARSIERRAGRRESLLFSEAQSGLMPPIVGESAALRAVREETSRVAVTDATVLLEGESGTGKELFARAIHALSSRARRAFVAINCAAIPDTLLESELFGHEKGSFTGAASRRLGKFELADGGTVFLDEIGELTPATQAKLLRVLQERSFHRVGGTAAIQVDVRIIAASNRPLDRLVASGLFREDLFYRVRVFPIRIPPLRDRPEDIDPLVDWFLAALPRELKKKPLRLEAAARDRLRTYPWPGNVRELRNCLERAMILAESSVIEERHLRLTPDFAAAPAPAKEETLDEVRERGARGAERSWLARALDRAKGDRTAAAESLGLSARRFEAKLREHALDQE